MMNLTIQHKQVIAQRLIQALETEFTVKFRADPSNKDRIYQALGFSEADRKMVES
jgi:hypothetical protein